MLKESFKNVSLVFILVPAVLSLMGLIFVYSTGINPDGSNNGQYIKQLIWILIGIIFALFIITIDYYRLVETANYYYIAGIFLLLITLVFGKNIRGSKSWLGWGGLGIQPSEIMKLFYILFFAKYLANAPVQERKIQVFFTSAGILLLPMAMILIQPDLGTAIVFLMIFIAMAYIGMADDTFVRYMIYTGLMTMAILLFTAFYKYYLEDGGGKIEILEIIFSFNSLLIISITMFLYSAVAIFIDFFNPVQIIKKLLPLTLIVGVSFFFSAVAIKVLKTYQWKRILVMINPEFDKSGAGYNIIQSKIAIGSGGFFGKGLFRGTQNTLGFLPEKSTDFVFSIISEELGFVGSFLVMALFGIYFYYIIRTIQSAKDKEGTLVATGIMAMFFTHFIVNIGMTLGLTPATGLPLPFISYGGSSYLVFIGAAALLSNIYSRRFVH
jgi:rod shape determining protein RodA